MRPIFMEWSFAGGARRMRLTEPRFKPRDLCLERFKPGDLCLDCRHGSNRSPLMAELRFEPGDRVLIPVILRLSTRPPIRFHLPGEVVNGNIRSRVLVRSLGIMVRSGRGRLPHEMFLVPPAYCQPAGTVDNVSL